VFRIFFDTTQVKWHGIWFFDHYFLETSFRALSFKVFFDIRLMLPLIAGSPAKAGFQMLAASSASRPPPALQACEFRQ
jgi:hypothetical protein